FKLTFQGATTGDLPFDASAQVVQDALAGLANVGANNVQVTREEDIYFVRFVGALARTDVEQLIADESGLVNGFARAATTLDGVSSLDQLINLTIEVTREPAKNKFRLITDAKQLPGGKIQLTVQRPWEGGLTKALPTSASEYTLEKTNPNLLVNENEETD